MGLGVGGSLCSRNPHFLLFFGVSTTSILLGMVFLWANVWVLTYLNIFFLFLLNLSLSWGNNYRFKIIFPLRKNVLLSSKKHCCAPFSTPHLFSWSFSGLSFSLMFWSIMGMYVAIGPYYQTSSDYLKSSPNVSAFHSHSFQLSVHLLFSESSLIFSFIHYEFWLF